MTGHSKFYFAGRSGIVNVSCPAGCPIETVSDVLWYIHLMSQNYFITVYCYNNGTCVNKNHLTSLLDITSDFTVVNNQLQFYHKAIYEDAYIGCVVRTNSCLDSQYYHIRGGK